jgi:methylthioribose-1-phosphate isomerase
VAIPLSTIDWTLKSGKAIPIEERDGSEVLYAEGSLDHPRIASRRQQSKTRVRVANPTSLALNPGFDVTPSDLITGIITPEGIIKPGELWKRRKDLGYR